LEDNLTYFDLMRFRAHYALQDPEKKLEREMAYQDQLRVIEEDRASRSQAPSS